MSEPIWTTAEMQAFFERPFVLLLLMIAGALGNAFKQMAVARRAGATTGFREYFGSYWPETVIAVGGVFVIFVGLLMANTLTPAAALFGGWTANSAADLFTKSGRSAALTSPTGVPPT